MDGLPSDYVYAAIPDSSGYLYIASQKGVSVYDGYRFVNHPSLQGGISDLYQDHHTFYFYDDRGLNRLQSFQAAPELLAANVFTDTDPNNDAYRNIFIDKKKRIWSTDFNYVKYYLPGNGRISSFLIAPDNKDAEINTDILEVTGGNIWVPARSGLWVWSEAGNKLKLHPATAINRLSYESAVQVSPGEVLLATTDGKLIRVNPVTGQFEYLPSLPTHDVVKGFLHTKKGLFPYTSRKIYRKEQNDYREICSIDDAVINSASFDPRTNLFWIATTKGLVKLTPGPEAIETIPIPGTNDKNDAVISIVEQKAGGLWMLTRAGEVWFYENGSLNRRFSKQTDNTCYTLDEVDHQIILSTQKGIFRWQDNRFQLLHLPGLQIKSAIRKVLVTPQNECWVVFSGQQIARYSYPGLEKFSRAFINDSTFWTGNTWNDMLTDNNGTIWLAGWMPKAWGIARYDAAKNAFVEISDSTINKKTLGVFVGDYYNSIGLAADDNLLFSAYGGWNRTDEKGKIIQKVDTHEYDIADTYVVGISEDRHGNVFFGTREGLHVWLKGKDKVVRLSQIDGLPTDYLVNAHKKLLNGKIALGIPNGIVLIDPEKILQTRLTNRLRLTQTSVNGVYRNENANRIELSRKETSLYLYFSDLSYLDPHKVYFRYKYSDENNWHDLGHRPELSLHHITPGEYNITVEVSDNLANRQEQTLLLFVKAHPAWWQTWRFRIAALILFIGLVAFLIKRRIRNIWREAELKHRIAETEMMALRAQMNPHFIFNCINGIDALIQSNDKYSATVYLNKFAKLLRNVLDSSKQNTVSLAKDLETLQLYIDLEQLRDENKFTASIKADESLLQDDYQVPPLVVQPYIENAILHGLRHRPDSDGRLTITVTKNEEHIEYVIEDNGVGRDALRNGSRKHDYSYGMQMSGDRVKFFNNEEYASVVVTDLKNNGKPTGTRVQVLLKIQ
ncbi:MULTISPECIES: sensor histidine kinase [unclassified Chitinophaga]|uniref:sensor histidine kinase n=1 Tax=unclassified Chitinophaga TaxID=2619133 RepID=UPI00300FA20D